MQKREAEIIFLTPAPEIAVALNVVGSAPSKYSPDRSIGRTFRAVFVLSPAQRGKMTTNCKSFKFV
jgi:hypothetical protein